jgi:hypothetical protein
VTRDRKGSQLPGFDVLLVYINISPSDPLGTSPKIR